MLDKVAPLLIISGAETPNTLAPSIVIAPVFLIITPPVPAKGVIHSFEVVVLAVAVLYCSVALAPKVTAPDVTDMVAVPSIESIPFTVGVVANVFAPEPERVRLL